MLESNGIVAAKIEPVLKQITVNGIDLTESTKKISLVEPMSVDFYDESI